MLDQIGGAKKIWKPIFLISKIYPYGLKIVYTNLLYFRKDVLEMQLMLVIKVYLLSRIYFIVINNNTNIIVAGILTKLHPLVFDLMKTDKMIGFSTNALDCLDWKPNLLYRDSNNECEYSEDALDKLISCAKLLTDDIRQITSFIKVILIFVLYYTVYIIIL